MAFDKTEAFKGFSITVGVVAAIILIGLLNRAIAKVI